MRAVQGARVPLKGVYLAYMTKTARSATKKCDAYIRFKRRKGFKVRLHLKAPVYQLKTISLFELVDTSTGINQLLLAREERMAIAANIYFENFTIFRRASFESSSTSASYGYFVIFRMDISFHYIHLAVRFFFMLSNYTPFFNPRQLFLTAIYKK